VDNRKRQFESIVWPYMRSAYNLARWLLRNDQDAEDVLQEASLKAYEALPTFRGHDARLWVLSIVRNTALNFLRSRKSGITLPSDRTDWADGLPNPEQGMLDRLRREQVRQAIARLEPEYRETLVLREMEGLSYKEIAAVLQVPTGTVMSRLSRARQRLLVELAPLREVRHELP
jgi:RNA polymerase sigma-70 factor, ECF subfamily